MADTDSTRRAHNYKDLTGKQFGRLTVVSLNSFVEKSFPSAKNKRIACWLCRCQCGDMIVVMAPNLRSGNTKSCGCLATDVTRQRFTTHGMTDSAEYGIWCKMIGRCCNPNDRAYADYGGRGVRVCHRWRESFAAFYEDMGDRPKGKTLDRIDNDGDYCPDNCRWATRKEQNRNSRKNVLLTFSGRTQCIGTWAEERGMKLRTLWARLNRGWSVDRALTEPIHSN